jgi:hypothetical protein
MNRQQERLAKMVELSLYSPVPNLERADVIAALGDILWQCAETRSKADAVLDVRAHVRALDELFRALVLLEDGTVSPMLLPARGAANRPRDSIRLKFQKNLLVAACVALEAVGEEPELARKSIISVVHPCGIRASGGKAISSTTLRVWRKKLRTTTICRRLASAFPPDGPKEIIRHLELMLTKFPSADFWRALAAGP